MEICKTHEYKSTVDQFNSITDKPICIFVYKDSHMALNSRIHIMSIVEGESLEQQGVGRILLACFNEIKKVEKPQ